MKENDGAHMPIKRKFKKKEINPKELNNFFNPIVVQMIENGLSTN